MPFDAAIAFAEGTFAAVVGGISGALVAGTFTHFASRRNRIDLKCDALENALSFFQNAAVAYWRSQGKNDAAERSIITLAEELDFRVGVLTSHGFKPANVEKAQLLIAELWEVTTWGSFQTRARKHDHEKIERIRSLCIKILCAVR